MVRMHPLRLATMALVLSLALSSTAASAQCSAGDPIQAGCGSYTYEGCCEGQILLWCENGWLCGSDCSLLPYCGWDAAQTIYNCDTLGNPAPGNNPPMQCPSVTDVDGDGYDAPADCDDTNPLIYPGAPENCTNSLDDDCDTLIDAADPDCAAGDDDVSDDDVSDDDVSDDDDDAGDDDTEVDDDDENPNLGVVCGCRVDGGRPAATLAALAAMVSLLWMRTRR